MLSSQKLLQLNIVHIINDGLFSSIPIVLSFMVIAFGGGEKEVGIIVSLGGLFGTLAALSTVALIRKCGLLLTMGLIILSSGLGFAAGGFAHGLMTAGFCFVLAAAGSNIFHNAAFTYIAMNSEKYLLTKIMSDFTAIGDIGRVPLVSFAGYLAALTVFGLPGWRTVCWIYGALGLLTAFSVFFLARTPQEREARTKEKAERKNTKGKSFLPSFILLRQRSFFLAICASALNAFCGEQVFAFLPLLLLAKGIDPTIIATFALGFTLGCFFGKLLFGRISMLFGTRRIFVVAEVITAALLVGLVMTTNFIAIVIIALGLGIVTKGTAPVIQTIITEPVADKKFYDDVFSINGFVRGIMNIITPLLFGFLAAMYTINAAYLLMAVVAVLSIFPIFFMQREANT